MHLSAALSSLHCCLFCWQARKEQQYLLGITGIVDILYYTRWQGIRFLLSVSLVEGKPTSLVKCFNTDATKERLNRPLQECMDQNGQIGFIEYWVLYRVLPHNMSNLKSTYMLDQHSCLCANLLSSCTTMKITTWLDIRSRKLVLRCRLEAF